MNIRRIELSDIVNVLTCNLCNIPENYYMRYWTCMILTWPELSFLAEDESGKVVGYVLSSIEPEEDSDSDTPIGQVNSLSVLRPYRRLGIAQHLMNLTRDAMLREDGEIEHIQLHVRRSNKAAFALYKKLGYKFHRVEEKYYADEEDAFIMRLFLQPTDPEEEEREEEEEEEEEIPSSRTQRRARKTWLANLWCFIYDKPQQFAGATMALIRRRNSHP